MLMKALAQCMYLKGVQRYKLSRMAYFGSQ